MNLQEHELDIPVLYTVQLLHGYITWFKWLSSDFFSSHVAQAGYNPQLCKQEKSIWISICSDRSQGLVHMWKYIRYELDMCISVCHVSRQIGYSHQCKSYNITKQRCWLTLTPSSVDKSVFSPWNLASFMLFPEVVFLVCKFTFTFSHLADAFIQSDLQLGNTWSD